MNIASAIKLKKPKKQWMPGLIFYGWSSWLREEFLSKGLLKYRKKEPHISNWQLSNRIAASAPDTKLTDAWIPAKRWRDAQQTGHLHKKHLGKHHLLSTHGRKPRGISSEILPQQMYCQTNSAGRQHCQEGKKKSNLKSDKWAKPNTFLCIPSVHCKYMSLPHMGGEYFNSLGREELKKKENEVKHT